MTAYIWGAFALAVALIISLLSGSAIIKKLKEASFGQEIREDGPSWHKKKSGTPTMGGFIFIIPVIVCTLIFSRNTKGISLMLFSLSFGLIGFIDDYIKVVKKRNLGLTEKQKFLLQLLFSVVFIAVSLYALKLVDTKIFIPFLKKEVDVSYAYIPLTLFVLIGGTNSVNLTDGVDGLATSVTCVVCAFFAVYAYLVGAYEVAVFNVICIAALSGFLLFNKHPAKVFMGDTGSLFLGGVVCSSALMLKNPLILVIAGGVYVFETLSVILQVASFKMTGKRIFKMSPVHHHFEMCGWSEAKIVIVAAVVTLILCTVSYFGIF